MHRLVPVTDPCVREGEGGARVVAVYRGLCRRLAANRQGKAFALPTSNANESVRPVDPKAMPSVLHDDELDGYDGVSALASRAHRSSC